MIINKLLNSLFRSSSTISVFRQLNIRTTGLTGREIARLEKITHKTALYALEMLESLNIVSKKIVGKSYYSTVKKENYIHKEIISNLFKKLEFKSKIFEIIKSIYNENITSLFFIRQCSKKKRNVIK